MRDIERVIGAANQLTDHRQIARFRPRRIAPHRRQHRVEREADEQAHQHRHCDGDAERKKELADDAAHERDRREHRADREGRRHHREADFVGTFACCGVVVFAQVNVAHDVLAHDDRVVDQQADAQAQGHHRHEVQREAEGVDGDEARDHRDRQGEAGDDRAAPRMQEQEDDRHRQQRAFDQRVLQAVQRALDEVARREDEAQLDVARQRLAHLFHRCLHRVASGDDVGVLLLEDVRTRADRQHPFWAKVSTQ